MPQGHPLITPAELASTLGHEDSPLLLDTNPAEVFAAGHLPGAIHLDVWGMSLIDTDPAPLRAFLWMIGHLLSNRGVSPDRPVVVYEATSGYRGARLWWFLDLLGHPQARLLDGGVAAWRQAGLPLTTETVAPQPSGWHGEVDPRKVASWRDVRDRLGQPATAILDTRSDAEYYGEQVRARRGGAIPGAVHLEWANNLTPEGTFKPAAELAAMYAAAGVRPDQEVITYCQGGYRAAHGYLALRLAGYLNVRNFTGSWKEWGDRDDLPAETPLRP